MIFHPRPVLISDKIFLRVAALYRIDSANPIKPYNDLELTDATNNTMQLQFVLTKLSAKPVQFFST